MKGEGEWELMFHKVKQCTQPFSILQIPSFNAHRSCSSHERLILVCCFSYFLKNPNGQNWDVQNFSRPGFSAKAREAKLTCGKRAGGAGRCHWLSEGRQVWALCEQPDRGRVVKGSIPTLIIDKYKGDRGEREERESAESGGVSACNSIF